LAGLFVNGSYLAFVFGDPLYFFCSVLAFLVIILLEPNSIYILIFFQVHE
jgi:hypothetical protein